MSKLRILLCSLTLLSFIHCVISRGIIHADDLVVSTTTGLVKGGYGGQTVGKNRTKYWFGGIPYAEPPVDELRFEPPVPKKRWEGILDATGNGPECLQGSNPVTGSEDCLYIKILTTKLPVSQTEKLPVMVYIHGGYFLQGSPDFSKYSPDFLLDEDIVVAAFHYRLGIFGFFTTGDMVAPGNNGLKDQILALKWIKDNIAAFGGDPDRITIFGQSAGGVAVSYLVQSNLTNGLFSGAIMQSGVSLCLWGYFRRGTEFFKKVADELGADTNSSQSMMESLKYIDADVILEKQLSLYKMMLVTSNPRDGLLLGPVMEPEHEGAVFSEKSYAALERGDFNHVPLIVGHTSLEMYLSEFPEILRIWLINYDIWNSKLVPIDFNVRNSSVLGKIGNMIKNEYFGTTYISLSNYQFMKFTSDDQFERPIQEAVRLYSSQVPVYYYIFSYEGSLWGVINRTLSGVGHTEDLGYLFDSKYQGTTQDYITRDRMVKLWTNFAKIGQPTPEEDPLLQNLTWTANLGDSQELYSLDINTDLRITQNPNLLRMKFWKDLYKTYAVPPLDTY